MVFRRIPRVDPRPAAIGLAALAATCGGAIAEEARLDVRYSVRLSVLPIEFASATLKATLPQSGRYTLDIGARGIGFGLSGKTVGTVSGGMLRPYSVALDTEDSDEEKQSIRISMLGGNVRSETVTPPVPYRKDRVMITRDHRRNVIDPLSAMVIPSAEPAKLAPSNCDRTLPVFEGTERFDITLSYLRTEQVKTQSGYSGPVLVCRARYKAISGHRESRKQVKYMEENRTIEVWLAPVEEARALVPWRLSLSTPIGTVLVQAQSFEVKGGKTANAG